MQSKYMNLIRSSIAVICLFAGLTNIVSATELVLADVDFAPYSFEENGVAKGIAVDLVIEAFKRAGYRAEVVIIPWARALDMVKVGTIDGLASAFRTPERERYMDFSSIPCFKQEIDLFVRTDASFDFTGDLAAIASKSISLVNQISYGPNFDGASTVMF